MTDRELLELAAMAAGYDVIYEVGYLTFFRCDLIGRPIWNPLTNYGDALLLAVKLEMIVDNYGGLVRVRNGWSYGSPTFHTEDIVGDDPAAVCRAITRAAAERGKAMKEAGK